jgi:hypothetical protein
MATYTPDEVFVPGRFPSLTYNERASTDLREEVETYLNTGKGSCLVVYGPSKTGKTVLIERWLPEDYAIWIKGDQIHEVDDLYRHIIDRLDLFTEITVAESTTDTLGGEGGIELNVIPQVLRFKAGASGSASSTNTFTAARNSLPVNVVKRELQAKPVPIVIDDFHFMPQPLRIAVAKAVKDLIRYTHVVLIAIPHQAFEPVENQRDMDWRVVQLPVKPWEDDELLKIAQDGFPLLGIVDHSDTVGKTLAKVSRGAPFIMQALCLDYVVQVARLDRSASPAIDAPAPKDWAAFLRVIANRRKPGVFDALVKGKDPRGVERIPRILKDGRTTEIYGATLYTLSRMGAVRRVNKQEVAAAMDKLVKNAPTASNVSNTLGHLSDIAHEKRGHDDPALDYKDPNLDILDPFLSFYLRHASWELPSPPRTIDVTEQILDGL